MKFYSFFEIRNRLILLPILIFIFIWIFLFTIPELKLFWQQTNKKESLQAKYSDQEMRKNFERIKEEKEVKAKYLENLESGLHFEDEIYRLTESFKHISIASSVRLFQFHLGSVGREEIYPSYTMQIEIQGEYEGIIKFLSFIRQRFLYKKIDIVITPHKEEVQCLVKLEIYIKLEME
ncbi:MAG: type 4a pilus biogenesis protein PilO [Halanaerobiales bacterium]|nr:type 4a pilus biogenesis protein PilO [Halanaerobiales bacterium]